MKDNLKLLMGTGTLLGLALCFSGTAAAQAAQGSQSQGQQPAQPANADEDAAFKAFSDIPPTDPKKRIESGEAFATKYPNSRYLPPVYSTLTSAYLQTNDVKKMEETGDKEIAINPNDVQVLAILAQTIPRALTSTTPNPGQELEKAEKYGKRAIEVMPTYPKPANLSDQQFEMAKNQTLAMAHSGIGLVNLRRGKFAEAIPELETSVKIDPNPDPVNYYLLGLSNDKASHFDDAVAAYNKCAAMESGMQATCKSGAEEAKKHAATQLSAPK